MFESKGHVFLPRLCKALHCPALVTAGGPCHCHSLLQHCGQTSGVKNQHSCEVRRKEKRPAIQKVTSTREEMLGTITIVYFGLRGSGVTYSSLLSLIWCFSVPWHTVSFTPSATHVLCILCTANVVSLALPSISSF